MRHVQAGWKAGEAIQKGREIDRVRREGDSRVHWLGDGIRGNLVSSIATKLPLHMLGGNATIAGLPVLSNQSGTRALIAGWVDTNLRISEKIWYEAHQNLNSGKNRRSFIKILKPQPVHIQA
jgi:hypothetical protein